MILFEDDEILFVDKPAGLIVHSDGREDELSLAYWLLVRYPSLANVGEPWVSPQKEVIARPGLVHRLDRTTSGVMIVAKTEAMWEYLRGECKARWVKRNVVRMYMGLWMATRGELLRKLFVR